MGADLAHAAVSTPGLCSCGGEAARERLWPEPGDTQRGSRETRKGRSLARRTCPDSNTFPPLGGGARTFCRWALRRSGPSSGLEDPAASVGCVAALISAFGLSSVRQGSVGDRPGGRGGGAVSSRAAEKRQIARYPSTRLGLETEAPSPSPGRDSEIGRDRRSAAVPAALPPVGRLGDNASRRPSTT